LLRLNAVPEELLQRDTFEEIWQNLWKTKVACSSMSVHNNSESYFYLIRYAASMILYDFIFRVSKQCGTNLVLLFYNLNLWYFFYLFWIKPWYRKTVSFSSNFGKFNNLVSCYGLCQPASCKYILYHHGDWR
jgi:hypothetical protein